MPDPLIFPYRPRRLTTAVGTVLFGASAFWFGREAMLNDRGMVINGLIHLGPVGATVLCGVGSVLSAGIMAVGLGQLLLSVRSSR